MPLPEDLRSTLFELIVLIDRASRRYRSTFVYLPPPEAPDHLLRFFDFAERASVEARAAIENDGRQLDAPSYELRPPDPRIGRRLRERIALRRAMRRSSIPPFPPRPPERPRPTPGVSH
jgi:hypothetical protein